MPGPNNDRDYWAELVKLTINTKVFIKNQNWDLRCRSVVFQNKGTGDVMINDQYTLAPNSTLQIGGTAGFHVVYDRINIFFEPGFTNRLEMIEEQFADVQKFNL